MPKVVVLFHLPEEVLGAERERFGGGLVEVLERNHLADLAVGALLAVVATDVPLGQGHDHRRESVLLLAGDVLRPSPGRHRQSLGQSRSEHADDEGREILLGHVRGPPGEEDATGPDEVEHLLEGHLVEAVGALAHDIVDFFVGEGLDGVPDASLDLWGPLVIVDGLVSHVVGLEKGRLLVGLHVVELVLEQGALVLEEPPAELVGAAVRHAEREVAHLVLPDVVVARVCLQAALTHL